MRMDPFQSISPLQRQPQIAHSHLLLLHIDDSEFKALMFHHCSHLLQNSGGWVEVAIIEDIYGVGGTEFVWNARAVAPLQHEQSVWIFQETSSIHTSRTYMYWQKHIEIKHLPGVFKDARFNNTLGSGLGWCRSSVCEYAIVYIHTSKWNWKQKALCLQG